MSVETPAPTTTAAVLAGDVQPLGEPMGRSVNAALSSRSGRWLVYALVFFWTIPTFGVLVSSFRAENAVKTTGWWTAFWNPNFTLDNYKAVLSTDPGSDNMGKYFLNSLTITIPATILSVGIALLAAYAFSWMKFRGRDWLFVGVVALLMVPLQMSLIPLLQLFTGGASQTIPFTDITIRLFPDLNLSGTFPAVWFAHICFGLPFCIFILKNFVASLPREVIEAARVDGAGHFTVFTRLVIPLSVPAIASLCIFQFMYIWNDYLIALIFAGRDNAPVTQKLAEVTGTRGQSWHLLTASGMIAMILPVMVFFALQRYFVRGLLAGAVKG
jgi:alpha-glucoside transport system permease protein